MASVGALGPEDTEGTAMNDRLARYDAMPIRVQIAGISSLDEALAPSALGLMRSGSRSACRPACTMESRRPRRVDHCGAAPSDSVAITYSTTAREARSCAAFSKPGAATTR